MLPRMLSLMVGRTWIPHRTALCDGRSLAPSGGQQHRVRWGGRWGCARCGVMHSSLTVSSPSDGLIAASIAPECNVVSISIISPDVMICNLCHRWVVWSRWAVLARSTAQFLAVVYLTCAHTKRQRRSIRTRVRLIPHSRGQRVHERSLQGYAPLALPPQQYHRRRSPHLSA